MLNQIILGDCFEVLKDIPDDFIDMTLTSPPYDNLRTYNGSLEWGEHIWKPIIQELYRVTKIGSVAVWVVGDATIKGSETGTSFKQALWAKECGFNLHDTMIYKAEKPPLTHDRYEQKFEYMFVLSKGRLKTFNPILERCKYAGASQQKRTFRHSGDDLSHFHKSEKIGSHKIRGNIWRYSIGNASTKEKFINNHPAIFPKQLAIDHILSWSNPGDLVLDPFCGSGTTAVACKELNRNYICIEKEEEYFNIACDRINQPREYSEVEIEETQKKQPEFKQLSLFDIA